MNLDNRRLIDFLAHIVESIERINTYTNDISEVEFLDDLLLQDAVIRNLEVIGEASNNILKHFPDFATGHPNLPLSVAYQMRNAIAHGYFKVDFEIVWKTIQQDLPNLHTQIQDIQKALSK